MLFGRFFLLLALVEIFEVDPISQMPDMTRCDEVGLDKGSVDLRDAGGVELLDVGLSLNEDLRRSRPGVVATIWLIQLEQPGSCKTNKQVI